MIFLNAWPNKMAKAVLSVPVYTVYVQKDREKMSPRRPAPLADSAALHSSNLVLPFNLLFDYKVLV